MAYKHEKVYFKYEKTQASESEPIPSSKSSQIKCFALQNKKSLSFGIFPERVRKKYLAECLYIWYKKKTHL